MLHYFIFVIRLVLLLASVVGFSLYARFKLNIDVALLPIFTVSAITLMLFFAGLLNVLFYVAWFIVILGLFLCIYYLITKSPKTCVKTLLEILKHPGIICFIFIMGLSAFLLRGVLFVNYDNFSHWALVVKAMLHFDSFPDGRSIIYFKNYPIGTATFIYYFCKIIGAQTSESMQLLAQGILVSAALSSFFLYTDNKKKLAAALMAMLAVLIFLIEPGFLYNLQVDILLGIVAAALTLVVYHHRNDIRRGLPCILPIMLFLLLIKDSAKIFVIANIVLIIAYMIPDIKEKRRVMIKPLLLVILLPLLTNILWNQYVDKAYPGVAYESNKFALTLENLAITKSGTDLIEILRSFIGALTNISSIRIQLLFVSIIILMLALVLVLVKAKNKRHFILSITTVLATNLIYIVGMFLLYITMMHDVESARLASFDRYLQTLIIYTIGFALPIFIPIVIRAFREKDIVSYSVAFTCMSALLVYPVLATNIKPLWIKPQYQGSIRQTVHNILTSKKMDPKKTIVYSQISSKTGLTYYVFLYETGQSYDFLRDTAINDGESAYTKKLMPYEYLAVIDYKTDGPFVDFIRSHMVSSEELRPGIYRIQKTKLGKIELGPR